MGRAVPIREETVGGHRMAIRSTTRVQAPLEARAAAAAQVAVAQAADPEVAITGCRMDRVVVVRVVVDQVVKPLEARAIRPPVAIRVRRVGGGHLS